MEQNLRTHPALADSLKSWLIDWMARELKRDRSKIDPGRSFVSYGLDSVKAMILLGDIEILLDLLLPPTLVWDHPDINALSAHLAGQLTVAPSATSQPIPSSTASMTRIHGLG